MHAFIKPIVEWLRERLGLEPIIQFLHEHKVPATIGGRIGWMYVFGMGIVAAFTIQVVTGIALATMYVPSAALAHESLVYITEETPFGWLMRALHFYGASAMVLLVLVHMIQVYLAGAYKYPREMNWISGVFLLFVTMALALTGQLLRWDEDGLWTVVVAAQFAARAPFIGPWIADFILAGPTVGGATLTRFFALHVFVLPLLIMAFVGLHVYLVVHHGISEPPQSGEPVDPRTYSSRYRALKEQGIRYWPDAAWKEMVAAFAVVVIVFALALIFGPKGPGTPPDPTIAFADPRPDWFLRWYYALLWIKPRGLESFVMVHLPILVLIGLVLLPVLFRSGERSLRRRPWAIGTVAIVVVTLTTLTVIGLQVPWSPAYETQPLGPAELGIDEGPVVDGARVFHERGCQFCHMALDRGGRYGPDLTEVAARISPQEITVRTIQGFRQDMPPYRDILSAEEMNAILAFLQALPALRDEPGMRP
jgi:ubiquinol-cytochrome c reductase cytochrome b subunit